MKKWSELPFIATDDVIFDVLETWPPELRALGIVAMEKSVAQRKEEEAKLCMAQLAEKRRQEAAEIQAQEAQDAMQAEANQKKAAASVPQKAAEKACEGQKSPPPE